MSGFGLRPIPAADLARITAPTSLIWGRHDLQTPLRVAEAASARHGWPLHVIDAARDDPFFEQPAAALRACGRTTRRRRTRALNTSFGDAHIDSICDRDPVSQHPAATGRTRQRAADIEMTQDQPWADVRHVERVSARCGSPSSYSQADLCRTGSLTRRAVMCN